MEAIAGKRKPKPESRRRVPLAEHMNRRLGNYALAATAAGVATLACAMPAEGTPVCKSVSVDLFHTTTYPINPARQIAGPFNLVQTTYTYFHSTTGISMLSWTNRGFLVPNSAGAQLLLGSRSWPANLATGASIGPNGKFGKGNSYGLLFTYGDAGHGTLKKHRGNFNLQQANYLGFQFVQAGAIHYGWVRLLVDLIPETGCCVTKYKRSETRLLGYGYETAPNTAIGAGSCSAATAQSGEISVPHDYRDENAKALGATPGSLGILALGSQGLVLQRGEK